MKTQRIQNRIKNLAVAGFLAAGTLLAGTGCDLQDPVAKSVMNAARVTLVGAGEHSHGYVDNVFLGNTGV